MTFFMIAAALFSGNAFQEAFFAGNVAFRQGDYGAATEEYERLVASSLADPIVFYNLGVAYHRQGRLGPAIANYERSLALDPGFDEAADNLGCALQQTRRNLAKPMPPWWESGAMLWRYCFHPEAAAALAMGFWAVAWCFLMLWQWRRRPPWAAAALGFLALSLILGFFAWTAAHPVPLAVAAGAEAPVRFGRGEADTVRFVLYEGDRVRVLQRSQGWSQVETAGADRGWIQDDDLYFVGPPYGQPSP